MTHKKRKHSSAKPEQSYCNSLIEKLLSHRKERDLLELTERAKNDDPYLTFFGLWLELGSRQVKTRSPLQKTVSELWEQIQIVHKLLFNDFNDRYDSIRSSHKTITETREFLQKLIKSEIKNPRLLKSLWSTGAVDGLSTQILSRDIKETETAYFAAYSFARIKDEVVSAGVVDTLVDLKDLIDREVAAGWGGLPVSIVVKDDLMRGPSGYRQIAVNKAGVGDIGGWGNMFFGIETVETLKVAQEKSCPCNNTTINKRKGRRR